MFVAAAENNRKKKKCSTQSTPTHTSSFSQILFTRVQKKPTFEIYKKKRNIYEIYRIEWLLFNVLYIFVIIITSYINVCFCSSKPIENIYTAIMHLQNINRKKNRKYMHRKSYQSFCAIHAKKQ